MYHVLINEPFIYFESAGSREELNEKANKTDNYLNGYLPKNGIQEEKYFGDGEISYGEFINKNPQYKNCLKLSLKQFRKNL